jgi:hexosaminidase
MGNCNTRYIKPTFRNFGFASHRARNRNFEKGRRVSESDSKFDATLDAESYRLQVTKEHIEITGGSEAGVFYAWQTLRQLLYNHLWSEEKWKAVDLSDTAKYIYRGYMLDVSRHFFNVETIKAVIDQISLYKINHMHLHLSDDQGWRIEIKSWPELTTTGGATEVGGGRRRLFNPRRL